MTYMDQLHFEILIGDFLEEIKPESCKDLEDISEALHIALENAIQDYINDNKSLNIEDYSSNY